MQFYQHFPHKAALVQETLFEKEGKLILVQEGIFPGTNCVKNEILEVFAIKHLAIKTPALLLYGVALGMQFSQHLPIPLYVYHG